MGDLSLENIMTGEQIEDLFIEAPDESTAPTEEISEEEKIKTEETTEVNVDTLFTKKPESVGGGQEESQEEQEDTESSEEGSSPKSTNFYSSIAKALQEEGIFPDLDDETTQKIKTPEDLAKIVEQTIQSKFDERQKRIDEALEVGIEVSEIKKYENTLQYLDSITESAIVEEGEKGEALRKQLIFQDFVNRGYSAERAQREVTKSINAGTDVEDAKESLTGNKEFFKTHFDKLVTDAKAEEQKIIEERKKDTEKFKKSLLEDKKVFGEIQLDNKTKQKIFDNITKPIFKDPDTGEYLTAIQRYEKENKMDFLKNLGLIFTLTDGFKNLDGLVKGKVNKEVKKGLRELEHTLNNTARTSDGNLKFVSGVNDDPEAFIGKGWDLDV